MSYIVGHPIKNPQNFYGRFEQKKRFFDIISGAQAQSITILGARRSGKTSFLRHVAHPEVMAAQLKEPEKYIMVYIDVSACRNPSEFYQRTIAKLNLLLPEVQKINLWKEPEQNKVTMFHLETVLCQFPNKRIILLLDEFDKIRKSAFDQDFLTELRALASVWEYELACITASYWDLYQLGEEVGLPPTSPFYNIFYPTPIYMNGLSTTQLNNLILSPISEMGVMLERAEVEHILRFSGSLPFFTQATASAWINLQNSKKEFELKELFAHLVADLSSYFLQWWRHFSEIEREVLITVANNNPIDSLPFQKLKISDTIRKLKSFAFIVEKDQTAVPNGELFRFWLQHFPGQSAQPKNFGTTADYDSQVMTLNLSETFPSEMVDVVPIYQKIMTAFNKQDVLQLCFELGIDEESLTYQNKQELVKTLLLLLRRQGQIRALIQICQKLRPQIAWLALEKDVNIYAKRD